ncbi:hypothetical protein THAOC_27714, partial [Thalassiosira oceanica]
RKKGFKKSVDVDEGRRRREETTLQIRKNKKDVRLAKRRQMPQGISAADTPAALAAANMLAAGGVAPGGYGEFSDGHLVQAGHPSLFIACINFIFHLSVTGL